MANLKNNKPVNWFKKINPMRITYVVLFIGLFYCPTSLNGQIAEKVTDSSTTWKDLKYDARATWKGMKHAVSRPLHWKGKDFAKLGSIVAGSTIIALSDRETSDFFRRQYESFPHSIQQYGFYYAKPHNFLIGNGLLYGFGLFTKNEQIRKTSVLIMSSSFVAGYTQIFARTAFGRARPFSGKDPYTFKPFKGGQDYFSFPSGHTVLGMTMAHSIAKQFDNTFTKIGIYTIGSIPGISRLMDGAHWLSDVAFGAAMGIIVVDCIDRFIFDNKTYAYPNNEKRISWNFTFKGNQMGVVGIF
jgi:membrane-associated phospholipid phosphatase